MLNEVRYPEVGIFYVIKGNVYGWGEPWNNVSLNGSNYHDLEMTHFEYFDDLADTFPELNLSAREYDDYPRGRVMASEDGSKFVIFADNKVLSRDDIKAKVIEEFNLNHQNVEWRTDEHYASAEDVE